MLMQNFGVTKKEHYDIKRFHGGTKSTATRTSKKQWQNNNFARAARFLYITSPSLHDYDVSKQLRNFKFYGGREHILFFFLS